MSEVQMKRRIGFIPGHKTQFLKHVNTLEIDCVSSLSAEPLRYEMG